MRSTKQPTRQGFAKLALILLSSSMSACSSSDAPAADGADLYLTNCSNCHGVYGEGDGPVSPDLPVKLLDLRYLSQRNGGVYPADFVSDIVDGRVTRSSHGPASMPVWGAEFARKEGEGEEAEEADADARVEAKIDALNEFLSDIQIND